MAEYYPLLAKAVASLPNSTPDSRKVVYERARKALIGQLRTLHPPVPDEDIERESVALDGAIERLETELASVVAPAEMPLPEPESVAPAPEVPAPKPEPSRFPASGGALGPAPSKPFPTLRTKTPTKPPVVNPTVVEAVSNDKPAVDAPGPEPVVAPVAETAPVSSEIAASAVPPIDDAPDKTLRIKPRSEQKQRPIAPQPPEPKRAKRPLWIIPAGVGAVVLIVAFAAFKLRDRPEALHTKTAEQQSPADAGKSVERVGGQPSSDDSRPQRTADQAAAASGQAASQQPSTPPANPAAPVAGRAAMLVEAPEEQNKVKTYLGTVVWRLDNVSDGQNQTVGLAVRADIDLPDDKMKASVIFQKNTDASLPASHTLKIRFILQPGSPSGNVKDINVPQMRREDSGNGDPLDGVPVPIVENSFLIGLTPGNSETANLDLLKSREWIDIPIRLSSGKIAKLTFEKTDVGQRDLQEAITAWAKP
ncbi:hypothetical protein [Beijerinckia sp. L45]|uniref:hypothetical protein n=1 Tax=Beijerinckia sp. L45 TaxID=1641855 RepID=UPI00131C5459|nr:hypothetical protein [Beijerinckia sp. L45]